MTTETDTSLELDDIQAAALMPRPNPYAGAYLALRIDDRHAGRELLRRLIPLLEPVSSFDPDRPVSLGVGLSFAGLEAIGVPAESLATFPSEFQQGMAARADYIGDVGENAPEHWEAPLGSKDVHVVVAALARDTSLMEALVRLAQDAVRDLPGVTPIWTLDVHVPPDGREQFGFKDCISEPAVEGTDILGSNPHEAPLKAGEFVLGYQDETGDVSPVPQPEVLGRNGTYVAFRKLHQRVAAFRQYLRPERRGRRRAGVACGQVRRALAQRRAARPGPGQGRPRTGRRPRTQQRLHVRRRPAGPQVPGRRARPADERARRGHHRTGPAAPHDPTRHQLRPVAAPRRAGGRRRRPRPDVRLRRRAPGPAVRVRPAAVGQRRQVHRRARRAGPADRRAGRRRVHHPEPSDPPPPPGLPDFVVNRGGEYCFMPGLRALRWLADLDT